MQRPGYFEPDRSAYRSLADEQVEGRVCSLTPIALCLLLADRGGKINLRHSHLKLWLASAEV